MKWLLFYALAGQPMATAGPFVDEPACIFVLKQIKKSFKLSGIACVTLKAEQTVK